MTAQSEEAEVSAVALFERSNKESLQMLSLVSFKTFKFMDSKGYMTAIIILDLASAMHLPRRGILKAA